MGGRREVSDQERFQARKVFFSCECLNIFASGCSFLKNKRGSARGQGVAGTLGLRIASPAP